MGRALRVAWLLGLAQLSYAPIGVGLGSCLAPRSSGEVRTAKVSYKRWELRLGWTYEKLLEVCDGAGNWSIRRKFLSTNALKLSRSDVGIIRSASGVYDIDHQARTYSWKSRDHRLLPGVFFTAADCPDSRPGQVDRYVAGYRTLRVDLDENVSVWVAPDLGCEVLRRTDVYDTLLGVPISRSVIEVEALHFGNADARLFLPPAGYKLVDRLDVSQQF